MAMQISLLSMPASWVSTYDSIQCDQSKILGAAAKSPIQAAAASIAAALSLLLPPLYIPAPVIKCLQIKDNRIGERGKKKEIPPCSCFLPRFFNRSFGKALHAHNYCCECCTGTETSVRDAALEEKERR